MASAINRLLIIALLTCQVSALDFKAKISPSNVQVCQWRIDRADERRCMGVAGEVFAGSMDEASLQVTFFEFSAPSHFTKVISARELLTDAAIDLDRYPRVQWAGWSSSIETRLLWLETGRAEWRDLGRIKPSDERELPGETVAVRLIPREGSPRTYFATGGQTSIAIREVEPVRAGGEVALCTGRANEPIELRPLKGRVHTKTTAQHGCVSFAGLSAGTFRVFRGDEDSRPLTVVVQNNQSTWLGSLPSRSRAKLRVGVMNSDDSHTYDISVKLSAPMSAERETSTAAAPAPAIPAKTIKSGAEAIWHVSAGHYEVIARTRTFPDLVMTSSLVIDGEAEAVVVFHPIYVTVSGLAQRNKSAATDTQLLFRSEQAGSGSSVHTATNADGRFEVTLPSPGRWQISAASAGQLQWKPHVVIHDVPFVDRYVFDIELPAAELSGHVVDASTAAPIADVAVEITWKDADGSKLVTVRSDAAGSFTATDLPERHVTLRTVEGLARMLGYVPAAPQHIDLAEPREKLVISMARSEAIARLVVVDEAGRPIAAAQLYRASTHPAPALIGRSDDTGVIDIPNDVPLPLIAYVVAADHPWQRVVVDQRRDEPTRIVLPAATPLAEVAFSGPTTFVDAPWGLIDDSGLHVPLLPHLLRQGSYPVLRGKSATIPTPGSGTYRLWVMRDGKLAVAGTVVLPSARPLVVNLD